MSDNVPVASRPTERELDLELVKLVDWQVFATHLPGLERENIEEIQRNNREVHLQKLELFGTWLRLQPDASWKDVILALENARENTLAEAMKKKFKLSFPVPDTMRVYERHQIQHTSNEKVFLPIAVDEVQKTNDSIEHLKVEEKNVEVKIDTADEIATQLVGLHKRFAQLESSIKDTLDGAITKDQITLKHIARHLQRHLEETQLKLTDAKDIDDLFDKLESHYSFLNCELLEEVVDQFVPGELQTEIEKYVTDVEAFEELTTLQELKDAIEQALLPTQSVTPSTCEVILKLSRRWKKEKMRCLNKLLEHIFSKKRYLLNHIILKDGSLCIRFLVPKSQVEMLIALAVDYMEFMYLLGVFEMMINDIPVLMEDENENFTFDSALLESSQSGNNEAVQFLLDLGVNINYSNSEGKTALMLASEAGHEEVVQTLVSAEANVDLQDSAGQTALMLANGNIGIIHCLLLAKADLDIQRQDGNTALHIAFYKGHNTVIELLLSYHASPVIRNRKDDTPFMVSVRGNNADILKLMLDSIPSSHLSSGIVLACRLGHSAVFSLLVKQLECTPQVIDLFISCAEGDVGSVIQHIMEFNIDPNTTLISGITPLMIASSCGNADMLDCLLEAEADVNSTDQDGYSPLTYAAITCNTSLHIVQHLLEAGGNPNILVGGITIVKKAREKGGQTICDLLLKYSALHLYKRFIHLVDRIQECIDTLITEGKYTLFQVTQQLEANFHLTGLASEVQTSIDLFNQLSPYYDFLHFEILVMIVRKFLKGDIENEVEEYHVMATNFEESVEVQHLKDVLSLIPQQEVMTSTSCSELTFKLNRQWGNLTLKSLRRLYSYLFSENQKYLSHITIHIVEEVPYIKFLIPKLSQVVGCLISEVIQKRKLMYHLCVIEIMLDNVLVLTFDEIKNFTFDSALLESSQSGNNEAVQFLLDLGVNINYSNSEGRTALMLACEAGHKKALQTLVSAEANVNLQDSAGQTALMLTNGNIGIIHCLLLANTNLDIQRQDGNTALHIACYKGHNTVIELLLSYHASPVIRNRKDDTPFMASVRGNNADILKLMIDAIPSSHLSSGVVLACRLGHSAVFSLLVKQLECTPQVIDLFISCGEGDVGSVIQHIMEFNIDPNTTLISGITPLMIASSCGHVEVIDTLIQMEADVNRIDTDNYSPLAYAITGNKSLPTVQYLLEAGANPHVLLGGSTILERAHREDGQQDICDILFKFSAVDLQKRFTHLLDRIEEGFNVLIGKAKHILLQVSQFLEVYPEITGSSKVHDLFSRVRAYSDFLSYELLVVITREFLKYNVEIQEELEEYLSIVQTFEKLLKIENLMAFLPQQEETTMSTTTYLVFKLSRNWSNKTLKILFKFYSFLFSDNQRYLSHMTVDIVEKVPCIKFLIPNSKQIIEDLVSEVAKKRQYMYLLGMFEMMISDIPVLIEDEDNNFTFESALQKATEFGNNEAVQFLQDLANVDYTHNEFPVATDPGHLLVDTASLLNNPNALYDENGYHKLIHASRNGMYQMVEILLKKGADPNIRDDDGWTALISAAENGHQRVVELLLEKQVDPNVQNCKNGRTALIQASQDGHYQVVEILLQKGADPNIYDKEGWIALISAAQNGHQKVVELLLEKQVNPNVQNCKNGRAALIQASKNAHYQVVEILLKNGADPNIHDNEGWTALIFASFNGHYQVVELLLKKGADPNIHDKEGWMALISAAQNGHQKVVELLLEKQVDPNVQNCKNGRTALIQASQDGHYQVVEILLQKGADPNIHDNDGNTAIIEASINGHYQVVEILLQKGADPNIYDKEGWIALISAAQNGHQKVVELLLEKQVDPNVQNCKNGRTALIQASQDGHYQVVEILLQKGTDPNIHDNDGRTALMVASMEGHSDIIVVLLRYNANPHYFVSIEGVSVDSFACAVMSGNIECLNILLKHTELSLKSLSMGWYSACNIGHVPIIRMLSNRLDVVFDQRDLIISCAEGDLASVVDQLMSGKITPDVQFVHGVTPLMISSSCGHIDIVEALITAGANVNKTDEFGRTALDYTEVSEQDATRNILLQHGGINGPGPESESQVTTSEEQKLSTDTSQSTIKSSQDSLTIRKKELDPKSRPFLIMKKLFKDTVKYSQRIFNPLQRFDNKEYSTTTHIPIS